MYCRVKERGGYETWQGACPGLPANAKLSEHQRLYLLGFVLSVDDNTLLEEIAELFYTAHGITLTVPDMSRAMLQMNQTYKSVCISAGDSGYGPGVPSDHLAASCCPPSSPSSPMIAMLKLHSRKGCTSWRHKTSSTSCGRMSLGSGRSPPNGALCPHLPAERGCTESLGGVLMGVLRRKMVRLT